MAGAPTIADPTLRQLIAVHNVRSLTTAKLLLRVLRRLVRNPANVRRLRELAGA